MVTYSVNAAENAVLCHLCEKMELLLVIKMLIASITYVHIWLFHFQLTIIVNTHKKSWGMILCFKVTG